MANRLFNIRKDIFENSRVLKNIDFSNDIDTKLSDHYRINQEKGYLEFLYNQIGVIKFEEYMTIVGELVTTSDRVYTYPIIDNRIDNHNYHAHMLLNRKVIEEQTDIIQIEFSCEKDSEVQLRFNNSYEYDLLSSFIANKITLESNCFSNKSRNSIITRFKNNNICLLYREGNSFYPFFSTYSEDNGKIEFIMDIRQGTAFINTKKVNMYGYHKLSADINYITITCDSHKPDTKLVINKTNFGRSSGNIYLKPFQIESKNYQVVLISKGNPELQYYDYHEREWCVLGNSTINQENIALRVCMQSWERIYDIAVIEN